MRLLTGYWTYIFSLYVGFIQSSFFWNFDYLKIFLTFISSRIHQVSSRTLKLSLRERTEYSRGRPVEKCTWRQIFLIPLYGEDSNNNCIFNVEKARAFGFIFQCSGFFAFNIVSAMLLMDCFIHYFQFQRCYYFSLIPQSHIVSAMLSERLRPVVDVGWGHRRMNELIINKVIKKM